MRRSLVLLSALLALAIAIPATSGDNVKLKLKGPRTVFMRPTGMYNYAPVNVRIRAELEGVPDNLEEYYCLEEEWEWGDDTESRYEPDCDPYEEGAELKRIYSSTHVFRYPGSYTVHLRLQKNGDTIVGGRFTVRVRGS